MVALSDTLSQASTVVVEEEEEEFGESADDDVVDVADDQFVTAAGITY